MQPNIERHESVRMKEWNELLLGIMTFTAAPPCPTSIMTDMSNIEPTDITADVFLEELELFTKFATRGLELFQDVMRNAVHDIRLGYDPPNDDLGSPEALLPPTGRYKSSARVAASFATYMMPFFIRRFKAMADALEKMSDMCRTSFFAETMPDTVDELRRIINMVQSGARPTNAGELTDILDVTVGLKWEVPDLRTQGARIKFKATATELSEQGRREAPVRQMETFGGRRRGRNPTGYAKFNFADLKLDGDDSDDEALGAASSSGGAVSATNKSDYGKSEDEARSAASMKLTKQHSSIDERTVEINDAAADPHWGDVSRKESREMRVRRRIPTGHPKMMKGALMARLSLDEDELEHQIGSEADDIIGGRK